MKPSILTFLVIISLLLSSCSSHKKSTRTPITNEGRYAIEKDLAPDSHDFDPTTIKNWNIKPEPKSKYGNHSPYVVFGKTYKLENTNNNFEQTGEASWYGKKFHGHTTSNMEIFDMYKLTAAHRTLPLPSYVEVTNLDNNKKVVVRVNDRGPFVGNRIIDLSWAAAKYLGYETKGVTKVHIKLVQAPQEKPTLAKNSDVKFLQVGAYSNQSKALDLAKSLSQLIMYPVHVSDTLNKNSIFRVRLGPLTENSLIKDLQKRVIDAGFTNSKLVSE